MKIPQILAAFLLTVGSQHALAAPVNDKEVQDLETRSTNTGNNAAGGNTASNPIEVEINVSYDSAVTFDADCWAMLCKGKPHVLRRYKETDDNRKATGSNANAEPFKKAHQAQASKRGVKVPPAPNQYSGQQPYTSAEEFPFASATQGGKGAYLFPAPRGAQNSQGGIMGGVYSHYGIDPYSKNAANNNGCDDNWYKIVKFTGSLGPYCKAFNNHINSATKPSECNSGTKVAGDWGFDVAEYAYEFTGPDFSYVGK
ncbi:hypothetical protein SI65_07861 [Aspergillus cristatus]|uniref:Deoxyribonuclease NucA/NucB domain-containing protein n=1 Tax=Aspergillus cristatus TaxID=573508 RepID=A0A1E3B918_ASPCR|nr:hypothetical protein SI65_07861 [Aspergillus cristatus]